MAFGIFIYFPRVVVTDPIAVLDPNGMPGEPYHRFNGAFGCPEQRYIGTSGWICASVFEYGAPSACQMQALIIINFPDNI